MSDRVQSKADAIEIADAFLAKVNEMRKEGFDEWFRKVGREVAYTPIKYTLKTIKETSTLWILTYERDVTDGDIFQLVSVNKLTGEAKAGSFDEE
jgi:hypothetical protein